MAARVRPAVLSDAPEIARVYVESWRWAYLGLLPQRYLDRLSVEQHTRHWAAVLRDRRAGITWVAHDEAGCCGLASAGPARADSRTLGEVYTLYVSKRVVGRGVGRLLLAYAVAQLKATLHASAILWVLEDNARARSFYESQGWARDGARGKEEIAGAALNVVRYQRGL